MLKDKESKQITLVVVVTIILAIFAFFVSQNRTMKAKEEQKKKEEEIKQVEIKEEKEKEARKNRIKNEYCDMNYTPKAAQEVYEDYIYIKAQDEDGCIIIDNKDNKELIQEKSKEASKMAEEKSKSFQLPEGVEDSVSFKVDQITVKNVNSNILGWALQIVYGDGSNSGKYLLNSDDEWIKIQ